MIRWIVAALLAVVLSNPAASAPTGDGWAECSVGLAECDPGAGPVDAVSAQVEVWCRTWDWGTNSWTGTLDYFERYVRAPGDPPIETCVAFNSATSSLDVDPQGTAWVRWLFAAESPASAASAATSADVQAVEGAVYALLGFGGFLALMSGVSFGRGMGS